MTNEEIKEILKLKRQVGEITKEEQDRMDREFVKAEIEFEHGKGSCNGEKFLEEEK